MPLFSLCVCDAHAYRRVGGLSAARVLRRAGDLLIQHHHLLLQLLDVLGGVHDYGRVAQLQPRNISI